MDNEKKNEAGQEATITIEPLSKGPLKGKSIRCLNCEQPAVFLVGFGRYDVGAGAFCEEHTPSHLPEVPACCPDNVNFPPSETQVSEPSWALRSRARL